MVIFSGPIPLLTSYSRFVDEVNPDLVGLSLSIYFNSQSLQNCIEAINADFPSQDIIVGGQAFRWGGKDILKQYRSVDFISTLGGS